MLPETLSNDDTMSDAKLSSKEIYCLGLDFVYSALLISENQKVLKGNRELRVVLILPRWTMDDRRKRESCLVCFSSEQTESGFK